ncbi:phosphate ABC transporter permease subunit PstC [Paenarthrobacter sp. Z7-10]|uniref:phosphate ABC transporter permease subunit PstC n=1 Tax=Paenarthrobacter sp. Z7-10 TaxID=2787635 RepID=UPI0022A904C6|nr:phosphate ABC transporter permease subunit PstC [Paenarthrobacter sp. Z7-10]MCZ2401983.1 phosphate ABC transporter permease subunit PstC [Paenarthrobacter sp. Z7-10]
MSAATKARPADRIFRLLSTSAAVSIMVILAGVALFLIVRSLPAILANWQTTPELSTGPTGGFASFFSYVGPLAFGTVWASVIALLMATPVAVGIALFISHYSPRKLAGFLGYIVDLLAAVPSVVFGLWGILVMRPFLLPMQVWLNEYLGWIPLFSGKVTSTGSSILTGAVVLAVMVLPIITSISREIFLQTPKLHEEAALALGSTRWEMIRLTVFPYARSGVVSAILLGLGRALGETMAVAMIISPAILVSFKLTTEGENSQTIASNIALNFPIASGLQRDALIGTGLVLFVISLAVNMLARLILNAKPGGRKLWVRPRTEPRAKAIAIAAAEAGAETAIDTSQRSPAGRS